MFLITSQHLKIIDEGDDVASFNWQIMFYAVMVTEYMCVCVCVYAYMW